MRERVMVLIGDKQAVNLTALNDRTKIAALPRSGGRLRVEISRSPLDTND